MAQTAIVSNIGAGTYVPGVYTFGPFSPPGTMDPQTIQSATNASPCVMTFAANHGFSTGDTAYVLGATGAWAFLNWKWFTVTSLGPKSLSLNVDTTNLPAFTSAVLVKCLAVLAKVDTTQLTDPATFVRIGFKATVAGVPWDGGGFSRFGEADAATTPQKMYLGIGSMMPLPTGLQVMIDLTVTGGSFTTSGVSLLLG